MNIKRIHPHDQTHSITNFLLANKMSSSLNNQENAANEAITASDGFILRSCGHYPSTESI